MLSGALYSANDPELKQAATVCRQMLMKFNTGVASIAELSGLFGQVGDDLSIVPAFHCDYGRQIFLGHRVYMNAGCVLLDCATITIGDDVLIGPGVQLITATHPLDYQTRVSGLEYAKPITIGQGAWLGAGAIVLPGITIGPRAVIGAGAVVTRDIPEGAVAVGNPARIRENQS